MLHVIGLSKIIECTSSCERLQMQTMWKIYDNGMIDQNMLMSDTIASERYLQMFLLNDVTIFEVI